MAKRPAEPTGDLYEDLKRGSDLILGEDKCPAIRHWLSTRSTLLDLSISRGIPGGRTVEIYGPEGHGKNVLLFSIMRECQDLGGIAILLASEPFSEGLAYDIMGMKPEGRQFILKHTNSAEKLVRAIEYYLERSRGTKVPVVIGVDSVAMFQPEDDEDVSWEDTPQLAGMARIWTRFFSRKSVGNMLGENIFLVFLNQVRSQNIGTGKKRNAFSPQPVEDYGTPGGWSLKHAYHVRIQISRTAVLIDKTSGVTLGSRIQAKVVKNKTGPFPRKIIYPFYNQMTYAITGIDDAGSCLEYLKELKALPEWTNPETGKHPAGYFVIDDFHGREQDLWERFHKDPAFAAKIRERVVFAFCAQHGVRLDFSKKE